MSLIAIVIMNCHSQGVPLKIQLHDCVEVINKKLNLVEFSVQKYQLQPVDVMGFLGEHCQVTILFNYKGKNENIICFAKFFPRAHLQVDFELVSGAFKKEIFVYSFLFKKIQKANISLINPIVPECYLTKENSVLIFEDLTLKGYKTLPHGTYLDYNHVVLIIKALAKLHASSLIYEKKQSESLGIHFAKYDETFYSEKINHKGRISFLASLKAIQTEIDIFESTIDFMTKDEFKLLVQKVCYRIFDLVKPSKKYCNVLCHGDLWSTNYLIKYKNSVPIEIVLLDFQLARYVPPAHDVMGFLYITTSRDFRKQYMEKICEIYYNELENNMLHYGYDLHKIISRREFDESCEEHKIFGAVQTATYYQMIHMDNDYMAQAIKDKKRWARILYEDRSEVVLDNCIIDKNYRNKLKESFQNLKDICEKYV